MIGFAQTKDEIRPLEPGQVVEREIAGGQSHVYQITLRAGQFARVVVEQISVNVTLELIGPDDKSEAVANLNGIGNQDTLSHVAVQDGRRRITARASEPNAIAGGYRLRIEVKDSATAEDRLRIAAERSLAEARKLRGEAAVERFRSTLDEWRKLGDRYWEMITLSSLSEASRRVGRIQESLELAEQALRIAREIADRTGESSALSQIGIAHSIMGRQEQAIDFFERGLTIAREAKLRVAEVGLLTNLGTANSLLDRNDRAIEYFEQAIQGAREIKSRRTEAIALHNIAELQSAMGRYEKAIELYEASLAIHRERKDLFDQASALGALGGAYNFLGRVERAIEVQEEALRIRRELNDRNGEGHSLYSLGTSYEAMGRYAKAVECLEQALLISREVKNRQLEANSLVNMGNTVFDMGRPDRAVEYYEQALRIRREAKDRGNEAVALSEMGRAASFMGRYERALELYEQALAINRDLKYRQNEGAALLYIGVVYRLLGLPDKAIECLEEALAIQREVKNRNSEGLALYSLGDIHKSQGRPEQAVERFEQALALFREVKNRSMEGKSLNNMGQAYLSMGRRDDVFQYFEQALAINRETGDRPGEGQTLASLGHAYQFLGQGEKAAGYFQQALAIHREVKDRDEEVETLRGFAEVEREQGRPDRARALIEESLQLSESLRAGIHNPERRASYFASAQGSYEFYIDLLMQLSRANPGKGFDALAVQASERARARGLLEILAEAGADIRQGVDAALLERERRIAWQLNIKARKLAERPLPEQAAALNREISQLEEEYQQAQATIRRASPHYADLAQPQPLTLPEIQRQLDDNTLLLEYSLGEQRSFLWAVTRDAIDSHELPGREQIEAEARRVYNLLVARGRRMRGETSQRRRARVARADAQFPQAARRLSRTLLAPVAARLGDKRLVIVADGALQYLPFGALPSPNKPNPLIVNHEIVSLPSISALAVHRRELSGREPAPGGVAVIADPIFHADDARMTALTAKKSAETQPPPMAEQNLAATRIIEHLAADTSKTTAGKLVIPRLPFTRREADRILAVAPGSTNLKALDLKASRATATGEDLSRYRYVHFATHGLLDSERPGLSALALSLVDEEGKPQDGFLRAHEIYNLKLPAELVVLSACQTGLGKEIKGEGLIGMTRGFMYAGAARVVVSLWNVNDRATSELMAKLYQKMLREGQRPAAALRSAQAEMWRTSRWRSPYYWAAFTLQGEWR
jgi:CHAT domain-containing protein/Tfp pilus assembly protein PilF